MWRKGEIGNPQTSSTEPVSAPIPLKESVPSPVASFSTKPASVGSGIRIKGEISGKGDFVFDGEFEGSIHIAEGSFTVGPNGRVTAEIEAQEIVVHGEVIGSLKGGRVQILSTGKVTGDMETRGIVIEDGAVLRSKVRVRQEAEPAQEAQAETRPKVKEAAAGAAGAGIAGSPAKDQPQG